MNEDKMFIVCLRDARDNTSRRMHVTAKTSTAARLFVDAKCRHVGETITSAVEVDGVGYGERQSPERDFFGHAVR